MNKIIITCLLTIASVNAAIIMPPNKYFGECKEVKQETIKLKKLLDDAVSNNKGPSEYHLKKFKKLMALVV